MDALVDETALDAAGVVVLATAVAGLELTLGSVLLSVLTLLETGDDVGKTLGVIDGFVLMLLVKVLFVALGIIADTEGRLWLSGLVDILDKLLGVTEDTA